MSTPSRQTITTLAIDIVGFSLQVEDRSAHDLFHELRPFIGQIRKTVRAFGGIVDKVLGDGILAYFGYDQAPGQGKDQATAALECAIQLQMETLARCLSAKAAGAALFPIRVGLNTAEVYIGNLGDEGKTELSVIGHGVTYAKRVEDACDVFMVMMSDSTKVALEKSGQRPGLFKRHMNVKHHDRLFEVFEFNPFLNDPKALHNARSAFQDYQGAFRRVPRCSLKADAPLEVTSDYGQCRIIDFSLDGLQLKLEKYLARGVHVRLQIFVRGDGSQDLALSQAGLSTLTCMVRWGAPTSEGYLHGVKVLNLSDDQRRTLQSSLSLFAAPLASGTGGRTQPE